MTNKMPQNSTLDINNAFFLFPLQDVITSLRLQLDNFELLCKDLTSNESFQKKRT